jgi:hypothetical protein
MRFSVVAVIDALGSKGLWRRHDAKEISAALMIARRSMAKMTRWLGVQ